MTIDLGGRMYMIFKLATILSGKISPVFLKGSVQVYLTMVKL